MDERQTLGIMNTNPNNMQRMVPNGGQQMQVPYGGNALLQNTPYGNYMGNMYQQQQPQQIPQNQFLKCRPVSSKNEASAYQIDLDGSLWVFPDIANGKIYTKQINIDGSASFNTYAYQEESANGDEYVKQSDFNKVINEILARMGGQPIQGSTEPTPQHTDAKPAMSF